MSLVSTVQRRSLRGRLIHATIYVLLACGGVLMVYPFLLMCMGSLRSEVDSRELALIPRYLHDDEALFRKYVEQRYNFSLESFVAATGATARDGGELYGFDRVVYAPGLKAPHFEAWKMFLAQHREELPVHFFRTAHSSAYRTIPELVYRFRDFLRANALGREALGQGWFSLDEDWTNRRYQAPPEEFQRLFGLFRKSLPTRFLRPTSVDAAWRKFLGIRYGPGPSGVDALNATWGTRYRHLGEIVIPPILPENPAEREDWSAFVRDTLSARFIGLSDAVNADFRRTLERRYPTIAHLGLPSGRQVASWRDYAYSNAAPTAVELAELERFLAGRDSLEGIRVDSIDTRWREWLSTRPTEVAPDRAPLPLLAEDKETMRQNRGAILWDFLTRNYRIALDETVFSGNAFQNTVIFCALNILTALIVNPIAAYALSRFRPRWGSAVLFVLMATMAFPSEVTQIPSFLLLRDLGLLNTFAALILPAAANGYAIFLLKGFFDSLPSDLYEAATLDGCGEIRMFLRITVPLSGPILAVVALGAFTSAYGAFMFALLVCQDPAMWTLMVYIYQLQQTQSQPVVFAALILASIPTFLVFTVCQKFILRGIAVPVEK